MTSATANVSLPGPESRRKRRKCGIVCHWLGQCVRDVQTFSADVATGPASGTLSLQAANCGLFRVRVLAIDPH